MCISVFSAFINNANIFCNRSRTSLRIISSDFVDNRVVDPAPVGEEHQGDAVIWSHFVPANCANGTSACWGNGLALDLPDAIAL